MQPNKHGTELPRSYKAQEQNLGRATAEVFQPRRGGRLAELRYPSNEVKTQHPLERTFYVPHPRPITTFTRVPHWLILRGVRSEPLRLYVVLGKYANNETGEAWPSVGRLAAELNVSEGAVKKWTRELVALGALKVQEQRRQGKANGPNLYRLIFEEPPKI